MHIETLLIAALVSFAASVAHASPTPTGCASAQPTFKIKAVSGPFKGKFAYSPEIQSNLNFFDFLLGSDPNEYFYSRNSNCELVLFSESADGAVAQVEHGTAKLAQIIFGDGEGSETASNIICLPQKNKTDHCYHSGGNPKKPSVLQVCADKFGPGGNNAIYLGDTLSSNCAPLAFTEVDSN